MPAHGYTKCRVIACLGKRSLKQGFGHLLNIQLLHPTLWLKGGFSHEKSVLWLRGVSDFINRHLAATHICGYLWFLRTTKDKLCVFPAVVHDPFVTVYGNLCDRALRS